MTEKFCSEGSAPKFVMKNWVLLALAITGEILGVIGLRFSEGFTRMPYSLAALGAFAIALFLVSRVMRELPVSVAYPLWAGGGTVGVALLGMMTFAEPVTAVRVWGIALVLVGVMMINSTREKRGGC